MKKLLLLISIILISSCGARKKVINNTTTVKKTDTVVITKDRIIQKAVHDSIIIDSPCDSTGILKPFKQRLVTTQGNITIESKNNRIEAVINLDSIYSTWEKEYKSSTENTASVKEKIVTKYKIPFWALGYMIVSTLLFIFMLKTRR